MPGSKPDRPLYGFLCPSEIKLQKVAGGGGGVCWFLGSGVREDSLNRCRLCLSRQAHEIIRSPFSHHFIRLGGSSLSCC